MMVFRNENRKPALEERMDCYMARVIPVCLWVEPYHFPGEAEESRSHTKWARGPKALWETPQHSLTSVCVAMAVMSQLLHF